MRDPLAPWNRMLHRLDGVHAASQGRTFRPSLFPTSPPAPPCRARPAASNDPLAKLSLELASEIVCYLNPADVVALQRVSKQWRVVLASEYIYTLALRAHFPGCEETRRVWELHEGGREMYPEEAVDGYRNAARRWCERRRRGEIDREAVGKEEEEAHRGVGKDGEEEVPREGKGEEKREKKQEEKSQDDQVAQAMKNVSFIEEPDSDSDEATVIDSPQPSPPPSTAPHSNENKENLCTTLAASSSPIDPEKRQLRATEENALNWSPRCSPKDPTASQELDEKAVLKDTALKTTKTVG